MVGSTLVTSADAPDVVVTDLRASYERRVLTNVSFTAAAGRTTVLAGPPGCGKTTVVRIVLGRLSPDRGDATVGGRSVVGVGPRELADVHRDTRFLFSGLDAGAAGRKGTDRRGTGDPEDGIVARSSVAENVAGALGDGSDTDERVRRCLETFDLTGDADRLARDLGAGALRRLALARVFVTDPRLVVLDDPVAALDPPDRDAVVEALREVRATSPATILLTCYDVTTIKAVGDDLVALVNGHVRAQGRVDRLLRLIESDDEYAMHFAMGARPFAGSSTASLAEYRKILGLRGYDQRAVLWSTTAVGVVCLVVILVFMLRP